MHTSSLVKVFLAVLAAASPAAAELSVTAPIGTTTCTGGSVCHVAWEDNGLANVTLAQQGLCTVALYTGNSQQQTFLQPIAFPTAVNVATTAAIDFVVDPSIGPNGSGYFIRFSSTTLHNPTNAANPYLSFSAKFTLSGMTGTFNSTVQAQLAGVTSAGGATATSATGATGATGASTATTRASTTSSRASSSASATHTGAASENGASALVAAGALFAGVVALF